MIKSIDTTYRGYKFRSRLEARWAVFFQTLGFAWEYEKEGFELTNGDRYLPDFYLNDLKLWVEIKPDWDCAELENNWEQFYHDKQEGILLLVGVPTADDNLVGRLLAWDATDGSAGSWDGWAIPCIKIIDGKKIPALSIESKRDRTIWTQGFGENEIELSQGGEHLCVVSLARAINAARAARFEYGETPA